MLYDIHAFIKAMLSRRKEDLVFLGEKLTSWPYRGLPVLGDILRIVSLVLEETRLDEGQSPDLWLIYVSRSIIEQSQEH